jgi:hypothetical protein
MSRDDTSRNGGRHSDKTEPQTIDGETGKPDPAPRRIDLSSLRDVRLELAVLYRQIDAGKLDSQDGSRRAYILRQIHDVIVTAEIERRLDELEKKAPVALPGQRALPARLN